MRKALFSFLMLAAVAVACTKEQPKDDEKNPGKDTTEAKIELTSNASVSVPVEGDAVTINFKATADWTAASDAEWLTLTTKSGKAGDACSVKGSVVKNETNDIRTAKVTITAGKATAEVTVTQDQTNALNIAVTDYVVDAEGGEVVVKVSANVDYEVVIPEAVDWVTVTQTKGMTESEIVFQVDETQEYTEEYIKDGVEDGIVREAHITVKSGALSSAIVIGQKTFTPYFEYEGDWAGLQWSFYAGAPIVFPQEGGTFVINVSTNINWRAYMSKYDASIDAGVDVMENEWCKLEFDTEASTITLTMKPNESYFPREDYLYSVGLIDESEDGNFGGLGWFQQAGIAVDGAAAVFEWSKTLAELGIPAAYNRLAYTATGALLISDGEKVHAINPADGTYWKAITYPGITPTSICSDDAGNVIVMPDVTADMDWTAEPPTLISGTELTIYYSADPNEMTKSITVPNLDYGTVGGLRVRGNLAEKAVITGIAGGASCWFGYDIENYAAKSNYYGTQNQGPLAGSNTCWSPQSGASISLGTSLQEGVLYRAYDGAESLHYLADAYTPNWAVPYEWKLISTAGSGGNENQNNLALVDYQGKRILAYTQGFHFNYSSNANIYVLDVTDINDVKPLVTINPANDIEIPADFLSQNSADVLLHPTDEALELFVINSGRGIVGKYKIAIGE